MKCLILFKNHRILAQTSLLILLIGVFEGTTARGQRAVTEFTYPKIGGEIRRFDDENPIWGPENLVLAFQRQHKSGSADLELYWYQPFREKKRVVPLAARWLSSGQRKPREKRFIANDFSWVNYSLGVEGDTMQSTYRFVYTKHPNDIYSGQLTVIEGEEVLNPQLQTQTFVSGSTGRGYGNRYAHYSPQSHSIVYLSGLTGQGDIYIKPLSEDSLSSRLTENEVLDTMPRWSPDGKHIVYSSESGGNMDIFLLKNVLTPEHKLNPLREQIRLTDSRLEETSPTWSPDGQLIAFYSIRKASDDSEKKICDLWATEAGKSTPVQIATDVYRQIERGPVWMPHQTDQESRYLVYSTLHRIYVVDALKATREKADEAAPMFIEGLAGYEYQHITDLDCTTYRSSRIALAYSALNIDSQKRIYIDVIEVSSKKLGIEHINPSTWRVIKQVLPEN